MNIQYIGVTSDVTHTVCFEALLSSHHMCQYYYCVNQVVNMPLQQCHLDTLLYIVHLAIEEILISTAIVSPCQEQVALLSNIVGCTELDRGHTLLLLLLCYSASSNLVLKML